jgi:hypothetical protein
LPADLPRERIEIMPPASERHCTTCDTAKARIGVDITEELDYVPASFVMREYVRPKYACGRCQQGVVQAVPAGASNREGKTGPGVIGARGQLQVRGPSAVVSAGADLRAPRSADHPAYPLGVERGSGRLLCWCKLAGATTRLRRNEWPSRNYDFDILIWPTSML